MLLPQAWLRHKWLQRALHGYPLYDPPHKVEERLLSRESAAENFDYFMRVRLERLEHFRNRLRRYFGVAMTLDEAGVKAVSHWGNRYAGLLLLKGPDGHPTDSYFTYNPPWTGENAGLNALFDMGIAFGAAIIANCPRLHWDFDPVSAVLPRMAKMLKRGPGTSFQRPKLTGFDDPVNTVPPLHQVYRFAAQMMDDMTTFEGMSGYYGCTRYDRLLVRDKLVNDLHAVLRDYPDGDPYRLREQMSPEDYLRFIDEAETTEGDPNE